MVDPSTQTLDKAPSEIAPEGAPEASQTAQQEPQENWLAQVFRRRRAGPDPVSPSAAQEQSASPDAASTEPAELPAKEVPRPVEPQPFKAFTSQEEYDRAIQAETDRRLAEKEKRDRREARRKEREQLAESDPYEYVKRDKEWRDEETAEEAEAARQEQEIQRFQNGLVSIAKQFDSTVVDPIVQELPDEVQSQILKEAPPGLEGRQHIVKSALKYIRESAAREAEAKLRKPGSAFRKEMLRELQDTQEEPELAPASPASQAPVNDMNSLITRAFGRR